MRRGLPSAYLFPFVGLLFLLRAGSISWNLIASVWGTTMSVKALRRSFAAAGSGPEGTPPDAIRWGAVVRKSLAGTVALALTLAVGLGSAAPSFAALPSGDVSTAGLLGARPGGTRLPVPIDDHVSASVDVGTGNLLLGVSALSLPGSAAVSAWA
jgi:hypothetical protein